MKSISKIALLCMALMSLAACSKSRPEQMQMADNVSIVCNPEVLASLGDKIPVQVCVTYPDGYFHPDVIMLVTPVLVYDGGSQTGPTFTYQGANIKDNYKVIPSTGGSVTENFEFTYVKGVEKSQLELRSVVFYGSKRIEIPTVKIADGCNVTSRMADISGAFDYKADGYQHVIRQLQEGQILYDVNSATVKPGQLRSESISDLQAALSEIKADERYSIVGTQIIAYASPEGGQEFNAKLSDKRAGTAQQAWDKISKGMDLDEVTIQSIGQDWEGFQEAVRASNIQDKELILRVLSMYNDPAVREREIRNMSEIFTEINKTVFPTLRRARFVTEVEYQNYTDEELEEISRSTLGLLDENALLRVASQSDDPATKIRMYTVAAENYGSQRAIFNLAALNLSQGKPAVAEMFLGRLDDQNDPDVQNMRGIIALQRNNYEDAVKYFNKAGDDQAKQNLGTIDILNGSYPEAVAALSGTGNSNEALAYILNGEYDKAEAAISGDDARSDYMRAIVAARKGDKAGVEKYLQLAGSKDSAYTTKAASDIEFAQYR